MITLSPAQEVIARDTHRFRVLNCGRRFGKALALDTPILTTKGFLSLKDVVVGDYVYDEKGEAAVVQYKSDIYTGRTCYRVVFSDGSEIVADASHDWQVETRAIRKNGARSKVKKHPSVIKTTEEMAKDIFLPRHDGRRETNYSIKVTQPIVGRKINFPIDPYFLGVWLGDGNTKNCGVTTADEDVRIFLYDYANRLGCKVRKVEQPNNRSYVYHIHGDRTQNARNGSLQALLRTQGLLGNKHVPEVFLTASYAERLALAQGLMDSDGYCQNGFYEFTSTDKKLADGVYALLCTLGIKAVMGTYDALLYGVRVGVKYRISFSYSGNLFRIERKKNQERAIRKSDISRRFIVAVEPVKSVPVQCLMVGSASHLFLCGKSLIPTHNTTLAIQEIYGKLVAKSVRVCYVAPTFQQARDIAWAQLLKEVKPIAISVNESRLEIHTRNLVNEASMCVLRGWEAIETLRGQQFDFVVIDEVAMMRDFWSGWQNVISPTLTDTKGEVLFISTPKGFNHFYELYNLHEKDKDFASFHYTSYDNPNVPPEEIDRQKLSLPEDAFAQEFLADFRKRTGLVYPEFNRATHVFNDDTQRPHTIRKLLGVDYGYTNPTALIMVERDSDDNFWVSWEWYRTGKTNSEVGEYVKTLDTNRVYPDPAEPDRIEEWRRMGINVQDVSKDVEKGIDTVRELLKSHRLHIHANCVNLLSEMETYHYDDKRPNRNEPEKPIKENDHGLDAMRYALFNAGKADRPKAYTFVPGVSRPSMVETVRGTQRFPQRYGTRMPRE